MAHFMNDFGREELLLPRLRQGFVAGELAPGGFEDGQLPVDVQTLGCC